MSASDDEYYEEAQNPYELSSEEEVEIDPDQFNLFPQPLIALVRERRERFDRTHQGWGRRLDDIQQMEEEAGEVFQLEQVVEMGQQLYTIDREKDNLYERQRDMWRRFYAMGNDRLESYPRTRWANFHKVNNDRLSKKDKREWATLYQRASNVQRNLRRFYNQKVSATVPDQQVNGLLAQALEITDGLVATLKKETFAGSPSVKGIASQFAQLSQEEKQERFMEAIRNNDHHTINALAPHV